MSEEKNKALSQSRVLEVLLDEGSLASHSPEVDHERQVAIYDLIDENFFELADGPEGPYRIKIGLAEQRLVLSVAAPSDVEPSTTFLLSLQPFRRIVKDYFMVCENYFEAIKSAPPARIEALDMGRRALHDEGSKLLIERLEGKVRMDTPTARRLFTLLCALHWKG
jgi:uncharacterized protein (UPF0262 family)